MAWVYLLIAGVCEILWAVSLKYTEGFSRFWPSVISCIPMVASFLFLAKAIQTIPVGGAYAVWTGIGATGAAIAGMVYFGEARTPMRIASLILVIVGIVGLKFSSGKGL